MSGKKKVDLKLDWCTHKAASFACKHWHYTKRMPVNKTIKIGVWEDNKFIGCVVYGTSVSSNFQNKYNLERNEFCELARVALRSHISEVTRIVSISLKMLKRSNPGIRLVVSFASPEENHLGIIYQAGNWIYTGTSSKRYEYFYKGRWKHSRRFEDDTLKDTSVGTLKKRKIHGKFRYLMPLDKQMRKQIEKLRKPYPKRLPSGEEECPSSSGGAIPTEPLHIKRQTLEKI